MSGSPEEEEDDYMSSKFLDEANVYENTRKEKTYSERRRDHLREQQRKGYIKPRAQLEQEAREEGLKKQVDEENKGMKMLMKMGFKKGTALGKQGQTALTEPITVELKQDRGGLGMASALKRQHELEEEQERERIKKANIDPNDFRDLMAQRSKEVQLSRRIVAGAHLCEKLDTAKEISENVLWSLRPEPKKELADQKSDDPSPVVIEEDDEPHVEEESEEVKELKALPLQEQLQKIVSYLRSMHTYCFWCGAQFSDEQDLNDNCPGLEEDEH